MHQQLILMRHGQATFEASSDYLRPLTEAGRASVRHTAERLQALLEPAKTAILSSDTLRTRQSAEILAHHCQIPASRVHTDPELYGATPGLWLKKTPEFLRHMSSSVLVCIGHNPAMSQLMAILTGQTTHMRAGAAAMIDTEWKGSELVLPGTLVDYFDPNAG